MHHFTLIASLSIVACNLPAQFGLQSGSINRSYAQHCATCHGLNGEGGLGGSLIDDEQKHGKSDEAIAIVIRDGLPDLGMPAYGDVFDARELRAMVVHLRELKLKADRSRQPPPEPEIGGSVASRHHRFAIEQIIDYPEDSFWSLNFLPDDTGTLLLSGFMGNLYLWRDGRLGPPIKGIPEVAVRSQAGMLDAVAHPHYAENGWIYISYVERSSATPDGRPIGATRIDRGRLRAGSWVDAQTIYRAPLEQHAVIGRHHGCRLAFSDGFLFFTIGERGVPANAQRLDSPFGKVHRIRDDGTIPDDGPFARRPNALPSIWTFGNRNAQGLAFEPATGDLWSTEHGPRGGDELNWIEPGKNYGWPAITHGINYDGRPVTDRTEAPGMEQPVLHWTPSIAVCGMDFLTSTAFPKWNGHLFVGGLSSKQLHRLEIRDHKVVDEEVLIRGIGAVRDIASGPDGLLYIAMNAGRQDGGRIYRLVPADLLGKKK